MLNASESSFSALDRGLQVTSQVDHMQGRECSMYSRTAIDVFLLAADSSREPGMHPVRITTAAHCTWAAVGQADCGRP